MLVARFSDNIEADIKRNWSTWMTPGLGGTYDDCMKDIEDGFADGEIREFPEYPGCFGIVHHEGLSCYALEAETIEDAIKEVKDRCLFGWGYGERTIGKVKLIITISHVIMGTKMDLHILEVEDYDTEEI